ncbi:hypothetical protein FF38_01891 [Lucilia cuprina]|uniref:Uncharacterized protein n=1 Tax=Lucilia cuprina TaxID=7375 RepID=A0A0L0CQF0_LUCCU|nr:hypothetical protein FF38_01891 [Lucilia cuprina]
MEDKSGSGGERRGAPMRKCPGVRAQRSFGFSLIGHSGLELRHDSILVIIVVNSSKCLFVVGHFDATSFNYDGPFNHKVSSFNSSALHPRLATSAGLSCEAT